MNFSKITDYLDSLRATERIPGCDFRVYQGHKEIYSHQAGFSDADGKRPVSAGDAYWIYSMTKPITMTAVMQLVEKGKLRLDDLIESYIPTFAHCRVQQQDGTEAESRIKPTVEHFMTMTGGMSYDLYAGGVRELLNEKPDASTVEVVRALGSVPLCFEPGTEFRYSMCHDVLAAIVEIISGQRFGEYVRQNIFVPLGMEHAFFQTNAYTDKHFVQQYRMNNGIPQPIDMKNSFRLTENYESGGAGITCTPEDYVLFADALACGGQSAGARILREESVAQMQKNRLNDDCLEIFHKSLNRSEYGYGLGVRTKMIYSPENPYSPIGEFGWDGAAGAYMLIDTENRISVCYFQQILNHPEAYSRVHVTLRNLVYQAL